MQVLNRVPGELRRTTCATPGTSTPRAAASVHASTLTDPSENALSRSVRSADGAERLSGEALPFQFRRDGSLASALFTKTIVLAQSVSGRKFSVPSPSAAPSASARVASVTSTQV